jgi:hypothetical protein
LPEVSAEEVVVAVVVIVTDADSIGPSNGFESCLLCNIGEGTVAIVLIESIGCAERRAFEAGTTEEKDVDPAIIVVVNESAAAAVGLDDEFFVIHAAVDDGGG